jgi:hypothetical protein
MNKREKSRFLIQDTGLALKLTCAAQAHIFDGAVKVGDPPSSSGISC